VGGPTLVEAVRRAVVDDLVAVRREPRALQPAPQEALQAFIVLDRQPPLRALGVVEEVLGPERAVLVEPQRPAHDELVVFVTDDVADPQPPQLVLDRCHHGRRKRILTPLLGGGSPLHAHGDEGSDAGRDHDDQDQRQGH
jgi:hypothetical protein